MSRRSSYQDNIDVEIEEFRDYIIKALNTYEKEGVISLLFFAELLGIGSNDAYTIWKPSPQLVIRLNNPFTSIETLSLFFNKIIVPINLYSSKSKFEEVYGISFENFIRLFEEYNYKYVPILTAEEQAYLKYDFYKELLKRLSNIYSIIPPLHHIVTDFLKFILSKKYGIKVDFSYVKNVEVESLLKSCTDKLMDALKDYENSYDLLKTSLAVYIFNLRSLGLESVVELVKELHNIMRDIRILHYILQIYDKYFVDPITIGVGGFVNYGLNNLKEMIFSDIMSADIVEYIFKLNKTTRLREILLKVIHNSPASYTFFFTRHCKVSMFVSKRIDINAIREINRISEEYSEIYKSLSEYRWYLNKDPRCVPKVLEKAVSIIEQIDKEIRRLNFSCKKKESSLYLGFTIIKDFSTAMNALSPILNEGIGTVIKLIRKDIEKYINYNSLLMYDLKLFDKLIWREWAVPCLLNLNPDNY